MKDNLSILVVEDEAFTARCLKIDLQELGINVLGPVAKGEDAVEIASHENPDLIFMDIRLAGPMDGIEAVQIINKNKNIPIVFMSGFVTDYIIQKVQKEVEYLEFIEKPINITVIKRIISLLS